MSTTEFTDALFASGEMRTADSLNPLEALTWREVLLFGLLGGATFVAFALLAVYAPVMTGLLAGVALARWMTR